VGLRFARGISKNPKITTAVLQIFGKFATKNIIYIDEEQLKDYIMGKDVEVGEIEGVERGQVIVKFKEDVIGLGLYDGRVIKNQIPKARRIL
jgi:NOL1/NOP2/fmu family ribosome biogenesis protein